MFKHIRRAIFGARDSQAKRVDAGRPACLGRFGRKARFGKLVQKPQSVRTQSWDGEWAFSDLAMGDREFRIRLYRFLRDHIPILKSVIWTWTRLAAAPYRFEFVEGSAARQERARQVLKELDRRIYPHLTVRFDGFDALLIQFFTSLFTDGGTAGELVLNPARTAIDKFYGAGKLGSFPTSRGRPSS